MTEHEQLANGIANLTGDPDPSEVRIIPIPEGERTVGQSGDETVWDREPLRAAVESGALDGATIVKGTGGENPHFAMDEQVPPDHILGRVDEWTYEDGVGPVGFAQLADEEIAKKVGMGLLEVSADMSRILGPYDEERGAYPVEQLVAMPRITILEMGAARNATIEPATAEALGVHPDDLGPDSDNADTDGTHAELGDVRPDDWRDADDGADRLTTTGDGSEEQNAGGDDAGNGSGDGYGDGDGSGDGDGGDDVESVSQADEPAEPGRDADTDTDTESGSDSDMTDEKIQELQEQLAAARQENDTLREEKESLENEQDELESELTEKEQTVEELESEKDELESKTEELEEERKSFGRALGARLAGEDSPFTPDEYAEKFDVDTLADKVVIAEGLADEDERQSDDYNPKALVEEQLAQSPAHRGQEPEPDEGGGGNVTEEQLSAANEWAYEVISGSDLARVSEDEQLSPRDLAHEKTGVDPAQCESRSEFVRKVNAKSADGAAIGGDD